LFDYTNIINFFELKKSFEIKYIKKKYQQMSNISKYNEFISEEISWEDIKYGFSKLGRYKANGKIFGKGKTDAESQEKMKEILDKKSNELLKKVYDDVKSGAPEFPNDKKKFTFLKGIIKYGQLYDSIVAATKKEPNEEGYMAPEVANEIIKDLQQVIKKFLDVDLKAVYSSFESQKNDYISDVEINELFNAEEDEMLNEELFDKLKKLKDKAMDKVFGPQKGTDAEKKTTKGQSAKFQQTSGEQNIDSERMKTLGSNKLPMTLLGVGSSLGAFSWLVNTEWFKHLFDIVEKKPSADFIQQTFQSKSDVFDTINPNQGMTQIMNHMNNLKLGPNSSPDEFLSGVKQLGGGNLQDGINALSQNGGIFKDPTSANAVLAEIAKNPNGHGSTLGEIFKGSWAGTGRTMGDALVTQTGGTLHGLIVKTVVSAVPKIVMKTSVKAGAGLAAAKGLGGILGPLGITLVGTGLAVKLLREKGKRSSRAKLLNDLLQSLKLVPVSDKKNGGEGDKVDDKVDDKKNDVVVPSESSIYPIMIKNLTALRNILNEYKYIKLEGEREGENKPELKPNSVDKSDVKDMKNSELLALEPHVELEEKEQNDAEKISLKPEDGDKSFDEIYKELVSVWKKQQAELGKENVNPGEGTRKRLKTLSKFKMLVAVWSKNQEKEGKNTKPGQGTRERLMKVAKEWYDATYPVKDKEKAVESILLSYKDFIFEKEAFGKGHESVISKKEKYLTQAFIKLRKSIKVLLDEKDKGIAITSEFIDEILERKMKNKDDIKALFKEEWEHLHGKYKETMPRFDKLYNENFQDVIDKRKIVAEKKARFSLRAMQFEKEGLYGGLATFGDNLETYNETLEQILSYYDSKK